MHILNTISLKIGYGTRHPAVLENVNVNLESERLVCLMGPNGIGKTTLLRTLSGLLPPISGSILLKGKKLSSYPLLQRARLLSVVLTDPVNTGALTAREVIGLGRNPFTSWTGSLSPEDDKTIDRAVEQTHTEDIIDKPLFELSDGQRQKVLIARALAQDGEIMILDEPNSHLDLNNRVEIMRLLKNLTRETGKTILMATHELDLALQMADTIWLCGTEEPVLEGVPEDLVLSGVIDKAFTLKGFDLRTGQVIHEHRGKMSLNLTGRDYLYLWTRNALEREGYILDQDAAISIKAKKENGTYLWEITHEGKVTEVNSIGNLLDLLRSK